MISHGHYWGDEQSFTVYCDSCDEWYEDLSESIKSFEIAIQAYGWSIHRVKKDCNYYCKQCTERHYANS